MNSYSFEQQATRFANAIELNDEALNIIREYPLSTPEYLLCRMKYRKDHEEFFQEVLTHEDRWQRMLVFLFYFCKEQWIRFIEDGIEEDIATATFCSFTFYCNDYYTRFHAWGIDNYRWISTHVDGHILRIGRLQFQPGALPIDIDTKKLHLPRNNIVLNVHIPSGDPLLYDDCRLSYKRAAHYFRAISPLFYCDSWLLYPALHDILPINSNILQFQNDYTILSTDDISRQAEERIWGALCENPKDYSQNSSLQKNGREYLMNGNVLGRACGILTDYYF